MKCYYMKVNCISTYGQRIFGTDERELSQTLFYQSFTSKSVFHVNINCADLNCRMPILMASYFFEN